MKIQRLRPHKAEKNARKKLSSSVDFTSVEGVFWRPALKSAGLMSKKAETI
jgi:hypothetical protein